MNVNEYEKIINDLVQRYGSVQITWMKEIIGIKISDKYQIAARQDVNNAISVWELLEESKKDNL